MLGPPLRASQPCLGWSGDETAGQLGPGDGRGLPGWDQALLYHRHFAVRMSIDRMQRAENRRFRRSDGLQILPPSLNYILHIWSWASQRILWDAIPILRPGRGTITQFSQGLSRIVPVRGKQCKSYTRQTKLEPLPFNNDSFRDNSSFLLWKIGSLPFIPRFSSVPSLWDKIPW